MPDSSCSNNSVWAKAGTAQNKGTAETMVQIRVRTRFRAKTGFILNFSWDCFQTFKDMFKGTLKVIKVPEKLAPIEYSKM